MPSGVYNRLKYNLMKKIVDLGLDTIKVMLLTSTHAFNADHNVKADIDANEITGTGYTAGGADLTNKTVTQDDANDRAVFDADDVTWTSATFTARHAALNDVTATNNLLCSIDFGTDKSVTAGTFTIQWASAGIIRLT